MALKKEESSMFVLDRVHSLLHRSERRGLASALIGEIVALLQIFEANNLVEKLEGAASGDGIVPQLSLPPFVAYQAFAKRLDRFYAPLPRQIVFFYTRLSAVEADLRMINSTISERDQDRNARLQRILSEVEDVLRLGDEILRSLRSIVSTRRPISITRA
jgi:hypothetical protein